MVRWHPHCDDVFGHNAWANQRVIAFLTYADQQLASYGRPFTVNLAPVRCTTFWAARPGTGRSFSRVPGLRVQPRKRAGTSGDGASTEMAGWGDRAGRIDPDVCLSERAAMAGSRRLKTGILLAQTIHHGNVHREQVSRPDELGFDAPDLSLIYP